MKFSAFAVVYGIIFGGFFWGVCGLLAKVLASVFTLDLDQEIAIHTFLDLLAFIFCGIIVYMAADKDDTDDGETESVEDDSEFEQRARRGVELLDEYARRKGGLGEP